MADRKFSSGPWRIASEKTRDGDVIVMSPDWEIAWVRADAGDVPEGDQSETEANAYLIAAAPCLYVALEDLLQFGWWENAPASREKAEAALAKARGETPASEAPMGTPVSVEQAR